MRPQQFTAELDGAGGVSVLQPYRVSDNTPAELPSRSRRRFMGWEITSYINDIQPIR